MSLQCCTLSVVCVSLPQFLASAVSLRIAEWTAVLRWPEVKQSGEDRSDVSKFKHGGRTEKILVLGPWSFLTSKQARRSSLDVTDFEHLWPPNSLRLSWTFVIVSTNQNESMLLSSHLPPLPPFTSDLTSINLFYISISCTLLSVNIFGFYEFLFCSVFLLPISAKFWYRIGCFMLKTDFDIRDCFIGRNHEHRDCTVQRKAAASYVDWCHCWVINLTKPNLKYYFYINIELFPLYLAHWFKTESKILQFPFTIRF
jgi:hypothetical protein